MLCERLLMKSKVAMRDIGLTYPVSDAEPPIGLSEAQTAATAVCPLHGGLIGDHLAVGDHYGKAYLCPVGRSYWRLTKRRGMHTRLTWPRNL